MAQRRHISAQLGKLLTIPWADRWLLIQVFVLLGVARLVLKVVSFRRIARHLGPLQAETSAEMPPEHLAQAKRIAWAVSRVSPHTPWTSNCFPQALAVKFWLRRQHIPSTLYLGVALNREDAGQTDAADMQAHAWLRCGSLYVTGGKGDERFTVIAYFGE